jgi:glyoxylase-like metal-dependent hydrolase (beta-lactamase superfamily II)
VKTYTLGSLEIHKLVEIDRLAVDASSLFSNVTAEMVDKNREWLGPNLVEPGSYRIFLSFHSYVIKTPTLNILVDTCIGNHKQRPTMPEWHDLTTDYIGRLARIGIAPEDVDIVMCTHLHADHVGWNTKLENGRWVPTFPNARYLMSRLDYELFNATHLSNPELLVNRGSFVDSVLPVVEHGLAIMVDESDIIDSQLTGKIWMESAAGHSPGSLNLQLHDGGSRACICGDVIHHPIQAAIPEISNTADYNREDALASRRALLERCADTDTILLSGHFPDPTAGRVISHKEAFRFLFDE